jgi:transposase
MPLIEPDSVIWARGGYSHCIGEDVSERLDIIPAQFRKIVTLCPKFVCQSCKGAVVQASEPESLVPGGMPTERPLHMRWSANMQTIFLFLAGHRSTAAGASISTDLPRPIGSALPPSNYVRSPTP